MLERGAVIRGKYRIERVLGKGAMGIVALAHHLDLDQPVAIKVLLPGARDDDAMVQRFRREARAMVQLKSEHVTKVFDVGTLENGAPYMVMEYLEGKDLGQWLREQKRLAPGFAVDLVLQACEGLAEAHAAGIVHRDIKPANFFLTKAPDGTPLLKVLDFGIAKAPHAVNEDFTSSQALMGTPIYMSPEQMHSSKKVDARTDIWALGVVLYELVSGRRPFRADSYAGLCLAVTRAPMRPLDDVDIADGLEAIIVRCLQKEQWRRFGDVAELAAALVPYAGTAAQASRSSERAACILAFAGAPMGVGANESFKAPTVSRKRPAEPVASGPPSTIDVRSRASRSSPGATTIGIASTGRARAQRDSVTNLSARPARWGLRYLLMGSVSLGVGLVLVLLVVRGQDLPEQRAARASDAIMAPATDVVHTAAAPDLAVVSDVDTVVAPSLPPLDAGVEDAAPSPPPEEPSAQSAKPAGRTGAKSDSGREKSKRSRRAGSGKRDAEAAEDAQPVDPASIDPYGPFE
jgi:serine/threonine-protein kinase